jgi:hypothetical protein
MTNKYFSASVFWGLALVIAGSMLSGCVVRPPREGYYDRDHHRYYHEGHWHDCVEHDEHCH